MTTSHQDVLEAFNRRAKRIVEELSTQVFWAHGYDELRIALLREIEEFNESVKVAMDEESRTEEKAALHHVCCMTSDVLGIVSRLASRGLRDSPNIVTVGKIEKALHSCLILRDTSHAIRAGVTLFTTDGLYCGNVRTQSNDRCYELWGITQPESNAILAAFKEKEVLMLTNIRPVKVEESKPVNKKLIKDMLLTELEAELTSIKKRIADGQCCTIVGKIASDDIEAEIKAREDPAIKRMTAEELLRSSQYLKRSIENLTGIDSCAKYGPSNSDHIKHALRKETENLSRIDREITNRYKRTVMTKKDLTEMLDHMPILKIELLADKLKITFNAALQLTMDFDGERFSMPYTDLHDFLEQSSIHLDAYRKSLYHHAFDSALATAIFEQGKKVPFSSKTFQFSLEGFERSSISAFDASIATFRQGLEKNRQCLGERNVNVHL